MEGCLLEVCVDSMESAMAAIEAGADRLELCQDLIVGGTTPSSVLLQMIKENSNIKVHTLIRPRYGDFLYSDYEYERMKREIDLLVKAGADGVVIGSLNKDGSLNEEQMSGLIEAANGVTITLHRAFDVCRNPFLCLEQAMHLGIHNILTSGQKNNCLEGVELLKKLQVCANGKIHILAGAGINNQVIPEIYHMTGITHFHMSGKKIMESQMIYRKEDVSMGLPGFDEFSIWQTNKENIIKAKKVLQECIN